ncbi:MAG: integrase core domain-containing protein [Bacteroidota bacterium]
MCNTSLILDGGPENQGVLRHYTDASPIHRQVAMRDIIQSNSMVESVNKHLKYRYLFTQTLTDSRAVKKYLKVAIPDYNTKPHSSLYGLTPKEVLSGAKPEKDRFLQDKKKAMKTRLETNPNLKCIYCE